MESNMQYVQDEEKRNGSIPGGLFGALLGALVGAVLWCLVAILTEHIYAMIGFVVGLIVGFGYDLLKGRKGIVRMITVLVCVILSVVLGTVGAYAWWMHDSYVEETEFIATATKEELAEAYLSPEELADLHSYPAALQRVMLESLEVTMPSENEYYQLMLQDSEFIKDVSGECLSSIFFALLGSFALILSGGKKDNESTDTAEAVSASIEAASVKHDDEPIETASIPAEPTDETPNEVQA